MKTLGKILFATMIFFPIHVYAVEGTCSWHGGVNCAVGPDWDLSAICNDGWTDSGELYFQQTQCQQFYSCMAIQWQQKSNTHEMESDRSRYANLINQISALNIEYPMIEVRLQQEAAGQGMTTGGLASIIKSEQTKNRNQVTTLTYDATLLDQKLRTAQFSINSACGAKGVLPVTQETCNQQYGYNSLLNGNSCTCKDNYMFNESKQCVPAGNECLSRYGNKAIPSSATSCSCVYGYHMDTVQQKCVEDSKPVKFIPANVKKWVDDNYWKRDIECSSNTSFTQDELKICSQYITPLYRQKYNWQITTPSVTSPTPVIIPVVLPVETPKSLVTISKPRITEVVKPLEVKNTIEATITNTQEASSTIEATPPVVEEVIVQPSQSSPLIPPPAPKTFWSKVISWFKFW